ncbi:MAG: D-amino acid aminotransferase [Gallionella sp.]
MTIYLNGEYLAIEEAKISVLDRGFIFGDGVYEVIPVYSRRAFRLEAHLQRLQHSLEGIRLANPHTLSEWKNIVLELIAKNEQEDQYLYLHITRGVAPRDQPFPDPAVPATVFVMSNPLRSPSLELVNTGISAITAQDNRWLRCDIKAISLLPNVLLRQMAVDASCAETLLIRDDAFLTEGSASNIFVVKNSILLAPPKDQLMLPGITYDVILEIAAANDIPYEVRKITVAEVVDADELLLTSSTREVQAITQLDGKPVGNARPGPMFEKIYQNYQQFKRDVMREK